MPNIGRYRVLRRIGKGGMAEVLEALAMGESDFQRRVAIKRMLPGSEAQPALSRMFLDEARIASQLHHGNIVSVVDYGVADGLPFQVLEYVDGADAGELADRGIDKGAPMPVEVALFICSEVAHALSYAHGATGADDERLDIVHRDVKPQNVLVSWSGDVRLADFGIAFARQRVETTSAGVAKGTLLFMAPEQATRGDIDQRTDLFSLGCVLQALLTDESPLAGEDKMMGLIAGGELSAHAGLPDDVRAIVARAVRRSKADRYDSADQMGADLGAALARRIDRDARSITRAWLDGLRPPKPPTSAGKLDALFNVDLVLAGQDAGVREFATMHRDAETVPSAPSSPPSARGRGAAAIAVLLAAGIAAGAWALLRSPDSDSGAVASTELPDAAAPIAAPPDPIPDPVPVTEPDAAPPPVRKPPTRKSDPPPKQDPAPDPKGTGFVSIGGSGAHRARIRVDGRAKGYAPRKFELPTGSHDIELIDADGKRVGTKTIVITERHTATSPLRWIVRD